MFYLVFLEMRVLGHWGAVILYKKVLLDQGSGPKGVWGRKESLPWLP